MTDMLFGSREAWIANPFGKLWTVPAIKGQLTQEEIQQRMKARGYQQNVAIVAPTAASFYKLNMGKLARQYLINAALTEQVK